jgi:hypothetical protein
MEGRSRRGFDALDSRTAARYQIKGRQPTAENRSRQLGVIRGLERRDFDRLVALILSPDFKVLEAYRMPYRTVRKHGKFNKHQNGHVLHLDKRLLSDPNVRDITALLRRYERRVAH